MACVSLVCFPTTAASMADGSGIFPINYAAGNFTSMGVVFGYAVTVTVSSDEIKDKKWIYKKCKIIQNLQNVFHLEILQVDVAGYWFTE